jgi:hypothetical protein
VKRLKGFEPSTLLHGKQSVWFLFAADIPCKNEGFRVGASFCDSTAFTASSREFGHRIGTELGCPSTVMLSGEQAAGRVARYRNHGFVRQPHAKALAARQSRTGANQGAQRTLIPRVLSQRSELEYWRSGASGTWPMRTPRRVLGGQMAT